MKDFALTALVPKQAGWMEDRIVMALPDATEWLPVLTEWIELVADMANHTPALVGGTFRSFWSGPRSRNLSSPLLFRVTEGALGWPESAAWVKVETSFLPPATPTRPDSELFVYNTSWVVTPSNVQAHMEVSGTRTLRGPVITAAYIHELSSNPLELLADVGLSGAIKGFPTTPGAFRVKADVGGVMYEQRVEVIPSPVFPDVLDVWLEDGTTVPLDQMVGNAQWFAF